MGKKNPEIQAASRMGTMEALRKVWLRKEGGGGGVRVTGVRDGEEDEGQDSKKPEKMPPLLNTLGQNTKWPEKK